MSTIESLQEIVKQKLEDKKGKAFAIFDFDNTLVTGDVGELTLEYLCKEGLLPEQFFKTYNAILTEGKTKEAYLFYARAFAGFTPKEVFEFTKTVLQKPSNGIILNPSAVALFQFVKGLGVETWIVSASLEVSVKAAMEQFGLEANLIGVRPMLQDSVFTEELEIPTSIIEGKVECMKKHISQEISPLLVVDDSITGIKLLETADIPVVVGRKNALEKLAEERSWCVI